MQVGNKQIISNNVTNNNVSADGVSDTYNAIDNDVNNNSFSNDNFLIGRPYFLKYFPFYIKKNRNYTRLLIIGAFFFPNIRV